MIMKRKCNVVMLPAEKARLGFNIKGELVTGDTELHSNDYHKAQHLYITSSEEIKEGDWILHEGNPPAQVSASNKSLVCKDCKKIIATTDKFLGEQQLPLSDAWRDWFKNRLPQIPDSFIEPFAESNGTIKEVWVEWYQYCQSFEEGDEDKCTPQCDHCEKYYKGFPSDNPIINNDNTITISLVNE